MDVLIKEVKQQKGLVIAVIAAGLIFGFIVGRAIKGKEAGEIIVNEKTNATSTEVAQKTTETKAVIKTKTPAVPIAPNASTVTVAKELTAGMSVAIEKVSLSEDAWIVVREDKEGEMANILGAVWLPKGTVSEASVELLRGTVSGKKYFVVLWGDNGDRLFGKDVDAPLYNNGKMISTTFTAK